MIKVTSIEKILQQLNSMPGSLFFVFRITILETKQLNLPPKKFCAGLKMYFIGPDYFNIKSFELKGTTTNLKFYYGIVNRTFFL